MSKIYLYGFDRDHVLVHCQFLMGEAIRVHNIVSKINYMRSNATNIVELYMADANWECNEAYRELKKRPNDYPATYEFWDYISRTGFPLYKAGG